jgi:hypothetical protein
MARTSEPVAWLTLVDVSGPFLVGAVLEQAFPQGLEKIETPRRQRLRAAYDEWQDALEALDPQLPALHDAWVRMVLEDCLEYDSESLATTAGLAGSIVYRPQEHEIEYTPDFAVRGGDGAPRLLIAVYPPETNLENPLPQETWLATPAERMALLCRANQCRVGLVTNGEQWMLVNAPVGGTSGYASWYARFWWQEPVTLKAFQSLLGVRRCFGPEEDTLPRLLERSLDFQEEVTNTLGEQVRRAVEVLIQALGRADQDRNGELLKDVAPSELYEAGLTVMMRLVFLLSAEERGLLLLGDPLYDQHYAVSTLRAKLHEDADQHGVEVLERRHDAWSRLLATFRGIFGGIEHEALRLPALGGSLFDPDRFPFLEGRAPKTKWREQPAVPLPIDNRTVLLLMTALQILEQKGGAQLLSYRALDVEQIGHVYEGLLEFTAARVPEITLGLIGTKKIPNPQITLSELDSITVKGEEALLEHLNELTGRSLPALRKALKAEDNRELLVRLVQASNGDETLARRLLPFGDLIRADSWGNLLVYRQGSFAIVKGTDRRSSGTHYTPRSLTEPIVRYTLESLVYVGPAEGHPQPEWKLKSSADILALNVCDMACGSGAFLVEACRYLSLRLVEAWAIEEARGLQIGIDGTARETLGEREPLPKHLDDRLLIARRLVAQSCLYGVDINHLAVELAKLAIWLVTLAKNKPFSFLDHALRCGDSLVGLHDLEQLRFFNLKPNAENPVLFKGPLNTAVDEAIELRLKLEGKPADTVADVETQSRLLAEAEDDVVRLKCSADLLVAAEFWGESNADKLERIRSAAVRSAYYVDNGPTEEFQQVAAKERRGQKMFHWPLEFPEVIVKRGGFDAFVGNPPFVGGRRIRGAIGGQYLYWLTGTQHPGSSGNADLCAFFFLRVNALVNASGSAGLLATNTICQGDSREVGLEVLLTKGTHIYRAKPSERWPGSASLEVSHVWMRKGCWRGEVILNDMAVSGITSFLTDKEVVSGTPFVLASSCNASFQGTIVHGMGFILTPEEALKLISSDKRNEDVLFPYLDGDDLNSSPDYLASRWVINFHDWPLDRAHAPSGYKGPVASDYPECLKIVEEKVKPDRLSRSKDVAKAPWWLFWRSRVELYRKIADLDRVVVTARVSPSNSVAMLPPRYVFHEKVIIFPVSEASFFSFLQSSIHWEWARHYTSTLGATTLNYSPTDCFETLPLPPHTVLADSLGETYSSFRSKTMLSRSAGLTDIQNAMSDREETSADIQKLRDIHVEMDQAVAAAYGWSDVSLGHDFHETKQGIRFTISESARREVLQRLLKLNHERHEEELKQGLQKKKSRVSKRGKQTDMFDRRDV